MNFIYVETSVLAIPNYAVDKDTAEEIIERALYFSELCMPGIPIQAVKSPRCDEILWLNNIGPTYDQIEEFLQMVDLDGIYSARDILVLYQTIMERAADADEIAPAEVESFSEFKSDPEIPEALSPATLRSETERVYCAVALREKLSPGRWAIGSGVFGHAGRKLAIEAVATALTAPKGLEAPDVPIKFAEAIVSLSRLSDIVGQDIARAIWERAESEQELHLAVTLFALALVAESGGAVKLNALKRFSIGAGFFASLDRNQCRIAAGFSGATLNLCAQLVAGLCNRQIGEFGKPKQLIRSVDQARAWRVHITEGGVGLRLMYWEVGDRIEFANVGPKKELEIERGDPELSVSLDLSPYF